MNRNGGIKVISCVLKILFDGTVPFVRRLRDSMWPLTGLSGEYVTFDQNGEKSNFKLVAADLENWQF